MLNRALASPSVRAYLQEAKIDFLNPYPLPSLSPWPSTVAATIGLLMPLRFAASEDTPISWLEVCTD